MPWWITTTCTEQKHSENSAVKEAAYLKEIHIAFLLPRYLGNGKPQGCAVSEAAESVRLCATSHVVEIPKCGCSSHHGS